MCEVCAVQVATLVCLDRDGSEVETCSDCGPQLGWQIIQAIRARTQ